LGFLKALKVNLQKIITKLEELMTFPNHQKAKDEQALNLALKDQLTALKWVQENIGFFGGDRNKVRGLSKSGLSYY